LYRRAGHHVHAAAILEQNFRRRLASYLRTEPEHLAEALGRSSAPWAGELRELLAEPICPPGTKAEQVLKRVRRRHNFLKRMMDEHDRL